MKRLPFLILGGFLTASTVFHTAHAQTSATPSTPAAPAAPADPFVKGQADPKAADNDRWVNCFTLFEVYALDKIDALAVIEGERSGEARYRRVTELAKEGKARLNTLTVLTTKSGQRAVVEGIDEVRYPTEFAPSADDKHLPTPTAWETRNAGDTLELEPVIANDGRTCDLNLVPQRVTLLGLRNQQSREGDATVAQPLFQSQRLTTSIMAYNGEPLFLGTYTPPTTSAQDPRSIETWMAFMRVDVQGPTAQELKAAVKPAQPGNLLQVEYSIYSVDRRVAHDLLGAPLSLGGAWEKLQPLLKDNQARIEHLTTLFAKSGQRSLTEEVQEERYWTELTGEHRAGTTERTTRTINSGPSEDPARSGQKKDYSKDTTTVENVTVSREISDGPIIPATPTAFETRNTGTTVELEPVVGPDQVTIDINQVVSQTVLLGKLKATGVAEKYPWQPLFETRKLTSSQTILLGVHTLLGTLNPPGEDEVNDRKDTGRTWLLFVRALPCER